MTHIFKLTVFPQTSHAWQLPVVEDVIEMPWALGIWWCFQEIATAWRSTHLFLILMAHKMHLGWRYGKSGATMTWVVQQILYFNYHPCWHPGDNQCVRSSVTAVTRWLWPGNRTFLEVASMVVTWWIVAFFLSQPWPSISIYCLSLGT